METTILVSTGLDEPTDGNILTYDDSDYEPNPETETDKQDQQIESESDVQSTESAATKANRQHQRRKGISMSPKSELTMIVEDSSERNDCDLTPRPKSTQSARNTTGRITSSGLSSESSFDSKCPVCREKLASRDVAGEDEDEAGEGGEGEEEEEEEEVVERDLLEDLKKFENLVKALSHCATCGDVELLQFIYDNLDQLQKPVEQKKKAESRSRPATSEQANAIISKRDVLNGHYYGETLLTKAIRSRQTDVARWLIVHGTDLGVKCSTYEYCEEKVRMKVKKPPKPIVENPNDDKTAKRLQSTSRRLKKQIELNKPKICTITCVKPIVNYYETNYRHFAYIHQMFDIVELIDEVNDE